MSFGTITVGRVVLREALTPAQEQVDADGAVSVSLSGQEAASTTSGKFPLDRDQLAALQSDIRGLAGTFVPVTFTDKAGLNGYYTVTSAQADLMDWQGEMVVCDWSIGLARVGSDTEVDVEARLAGPQTRVNDHSVTGERWHAPPIGHSAYWAGSATPSTMTRASSDGAVTVYRGVPVATSPRYACPVEDYLAGRVRILDAGRERTGTDWDMSPLGWSLDNGIVQVTVAGGTLSVAAWTAGAWAPKAWDVLIDGVGLGAPDAATVIRNDVECGIVRLLWSLAVGRVTCDLTLRRGARLVEMFIRTSTAATIKTALVVPETGTAGTGFVRATSNDGSGNRYLVCSAKTHTPDVNGGLSRASTTTLDVGIGVELGGSSAVSGDQATDLLAQYLGSPAERTSGARR